MVFTSPGYNLNTPYDRAIYARFNDLKLLLPQLAFDLMLPMSGQGALNNTPPLFPTRPIPQTAHQIFLPTPALPLMSRGASVLRHDAPAVTFEEEVSLLQSFTDWKVLPRPRRF